MGVKKTKAEPIVAYVNAKLNSMDSSFITLTTRFGWWNQEPRGDGAPGQSKVGPVRLSGLGFRVFANADSDTVIKPDGLEYMDVYGARARDVRAMLDTLTRADRAINRLAVRFGYPRDIQTWIRYVSDALGIVQWGIHVDAWGYILAADRRVSDLPADSLGYVARKAVDASYFFEDYAKVWRVRRDEYKRVSSSQ